MKKEKENRGNCKGRERRRKKGKREVEITYVKRKGEREIRKIVREEKSEERDKRRKKSKKKKA